MIMSEDDRRSLLKKIDSLEILKIERPKYEVVEEEQEKELLTDEEKDLLKEMIENVNKFSCIKTEEIYTYRYDSKSYLAVRFFNEDFFIGEISTAFEFKRLKQRKRYTLKELGLEEE